MRPFLSILTFGGLHLLASACSNGAGNNGSDGSGNSGNAAGGTGTGSVDSGGGSDAGSGATGSGADGSGAGEAGGSGGRSTGGAAAGGTGGTATGGDAMGGVGNDGGRGGDDGTGGDDGSTTEEREFVRCFPWAYAHPEEGPLLAATPTGTVLLVGPSAPADLFPNEVGVPFLVEFSTSGEAVRGITFPDASGPQIITVSNEGFIFLAGQDRFDTRFGEFELPDFPDGAYYLVKLSPQLEILAATMVEAPATQVNALHIDANGDLIVGTAAADFEAGSMHPVVTKVSGDTLEEVWSTDSEHEIMPALSTSITTLPDGRVVAAGYYSRELSIGEFVLSKPVDVLDDRFVYNGWVAWLSPGDGTPVAAESWGGSVNNGVMNAAVTSNGHLRLLGFPSSGNVKVFDTELTEGPHRLGVLVDLHASGSTERIITLPTENEDVVTTMILGRNDETYFAAGYGSPLGDLNTRGSEVRRIETDGTLGPTRRFSTGHHAKRLALDTKGGIWISAGWETPFEWNGETHVPPLMGSGDGERCRMVLRMNAL